MLAVGQGFDIYRAGDAVFEQLSLFKANDSLVGRRRWNGLINIETAGPIKFDLGLLVL